MSVTIRPAHRDEYGRIRAIAVEGGSTDATDAYLAFIAHEGRLLVAEQRGQVVAFSGMVPVPDDGRDGRRADDVSGGVAMVTDLFVAPTERGRGIGGTLLAALLDGWPRRMTCSSQHAAALPVYAAERMMPQWRLLYLEGAATGGGPPLVPGPWGHDRLELVEHFAATGSVVTPDAAVEVVGDAATVHRLQHVDAIGAMTGVLAGLPAGTAVHACVPEHDPLAAWLQHSGFIVVDHDVVCVSPDVQFPGAVSCVHPGLA